MQKLIMSTLCKYYKSIPPLTRFISLVILQYIIWFVIYELWLKPNGTLDYFLTWSVTIPANFFFSITGYNSFYTYDIPLFYIHCDNIRTLGIAPACNGQVLYAIFIGFIVATPGSFKRKALYILRGIFIIYISNVIRVILLVLLKMYYPQWLHFNHKYTFTILVYGIIFLLWMDWINKNKQKSV